MFYMNCGKGQPCGNVQLCDVKIRMEHGKRKMIAVWRYSQRNCRRFHESPIRICNGRMVFNSGSEETINIVPNHLHQKYAHLLAK